MDDAVVGGRGLWRATLTVSADSGHSGSSRSVLGAVSRAARLVQFLGMADLPGAPAADAAFGLPPKLSLTAIHGGEGFSVAADRCDLNVDVRTTPAFGAHDAETLVRKAAAELDAELPGPAPTRITPIAQLAALPVAVARAARRRADGCRRLAGPGGAGQDCRCLGMHVQLVGDPLDRTSTASRVLTGLDRQTRRAFTQFVGVFTGSSP
ncbi:peptidase dimerization domain-containing protein [Streptomyces sp. NBC_01431]|uniref:peptidase dimerization domain-containing protein n=1 Tax=Streptomyces sp. NBC_01431 TaxID=2903863 RepID=UPI002E2FE132|nr:peptidase dimerization domain-containing protein [Streptomyces sp. NBC_01431]